MFGFVLGLVRCVLWHLRLLLWCLLWFFGRCVLVWQVFEFQLVVEVFGVRFDGVGGCLLSLVWAFEWVGCWRWEEGFNLSVVLWCEVCYWSFCLWGVPVGVGSNVCPVGAFPLPNPCGWSSESLPVVQSDSPSHPRGRELRPAEELCCGGEEWFIVGVIDVPELP